MIEKTHLEKIDNFIFRIPQTYQKGMRVEVCVFATEKMLEEIIHDRSLNQLINISFLPGVKNPVLVMPDVHEGYGFPIGAVAAVDFNHGVISPGGIGYDINCGVRLLLSLLTKKDIGNFIKSLGKNIFEAVPAGVGEKSIFQVDQKNFDQVLSTGISWAVKKGYADYKDQKRIESFGSLSQADPSFVSQQAKQRGINQLGTLGAGNHFVEIGYIETIYHQKIASAFGLFPNQITILIHTGSRGLGHQVATDYIRQMIKSIPKYGIHLPDWQLACAPINSPDGKAYFAAMQSAANFAWVNRQLITFQIRKVFQQVFGKNQELKLLYDVAHNIAKVEKHLIENSPQQVLVHRKGATRAFGPAALDLASEFQKTGQPVIIPGSMGTSSFILVGTKKAASLTFSSAAHGAGRKMSRKKARQKTKGSLLKGELANKGIAIFTQNLNALSEEAPFAYKDVEEVVDLIDRVGIAQKVAKLRPLIVVKG